jgi:F-type H+-transporting ATPase subunit gamma
MGSTVVMIWEKDFVVLEKVEISETTSMLNIEPDDDDEVLKELTDKYIDFNMYYALIDSLAAEHSARMQAMEAASKNAKEKVIIYKL